MERVRPYQLIQTILLGAAVVCLGAIAWGLLRPEPPRQRQYFVGQVQKVPANALVTLAPEGQNAAYDRMRAGLPLRCQDVRAIEGDVPGTLGTLAWFAKQQPGSPLDRDGDGQPCGLRIGADAR